MKHAKFYDQSGKDLKLHVSADGKRCRVQLDAAWAEYERTDTGVRFIGMQGFDPQYGAPRGAFAKAYRALVGTDPLPIVKPRHIPAITSVASTATTKRKTK
jgi:D-serine deaminase-like pyridoxal phosphate-dependent protein